MKLSLIISTLGRSSELLILFESLSKQSYNNFEVIIVDQNDDDKLSSFLIKDYPFEVKRIHTPKQRGLSRGRNVGWKSASGEVVLFPDDDCWYPPTFLQDAINLFKQTNADIVSGRAADSKGRSINGRFEAVPQFINRNNIWTTQIEWVVFFKKNILITVDGYNESIGIGAATPWQACEGQDIVLRALKHGAKAYYDPELFGHHLELDLSTSNPSMRIKMASYAKGLGYVLKAHDYSIFDLSYWTSRQLLKALSMLLSGRLNEARLAYCVALGRVQGYFGIG